MRNLEIKNIKSHPSHSLAKANASRGLQINFNQAEDALTIPTESRHDYKCGYATKSGCTLLPESGADAPTVLSAVYTDSTPAKNRQADVPQYGRSMIEMLGVLAIIGVLSVGGIAGYSKAMQKYRVNKAIEQITLIAGNIRAFFAPQKNYEGVGCRSNKGGTCKASGCESVSVDGGKYSYADDGCPIVKKAKIFPDEMITVTDGKIMSITNPFGGGVSLGGVDHIVGSRHLGLIYFQISYGISIDDDVCIELMSHDWTAAGVKGISLNGPTNYSAMMPISIETAVDKCSSWIKKLQEYHSTSGSIGFYFDLKNNCTISEQNVVCS